MSRWCFIGVTIKRELLWPFNLKQDMVDALADTLASVLNVAAPSGVRRRTEGISPVTYSSRENGRKPDSQFPVTLARTPHLIHCCNILLFDIVSNQVLAFTNHPLGRRSGRSVKGRRSRRSRGPQGSRRGAASVHFFPLTHAATWWRHETARWHGHQSPLNQTTPRQSTPS